MSTEKTNVPSSSPSSPSFISVVSCKFGPLILALVILISVVMPSSSSSRNVNSDNGRSRSGYPVPLPQSNLQKKENNERGPDITRKESRSSPGPLSSLPSRREAASPDSSAAVAEPSTTRVQLPAAVAAAAVPDPSPSFGESAVIKRRRGHQGSSSSSSAGGVQTTPSSHYSCLHDGRNNRGGRRGVNSSAIRNCAEYWWVPLLPQLALGKKDRTNLLKDLKEKDSLCDSYPIKNDLVAVARNGGEIDSDKDTEKGTNDEDEDRWLESRVLSSSWNFQSREVATRINGRYQMEFYGDSTLRQIWYGLIHSIRMKNPKRNPKMSARGPYYMVQRVANMRFEKKKKDDENEKRIGDELISSSSSSSLSSTFHRSIFRFDFCRQDFLEGGEGPSTFQDVSAIPEIFLRRSEKEEGEAPTSKETNKKALLSHLAATNNSFPKILVLNFGAHPARYIFENFRMLKKRVYDYPGPQTDEYGVPLPPSVVASLKDHSTRDISPELVNLVQDFYREAMLNWMASFATRREVHILFYMETKLDCSNNMVWKPLAKCFKGNKVIDTLSGIVKDLFHVGRLYVEWENSSRDAEKDHHHGRTLKEVVQGIINQEGEVPAEKLQWVGDVFFETSNLKKKKAEGQQTVGDEESADGQTSSSSLSSFASATSDKFKAQVLRLLAKGVWMKALDPGIYNHRCAGGVEESSSYNQQKIKCVMALDGIHVHQRFAMFYLSEMLGILNKYDRCAFPLQI